MLGEGGNTVLRLNLIVIKRNNILDPSNSGLMSEDRLQIREMDFYKPLDMQLLIEELLLEKKS